MTVELPKLITLPELASLLRRSIAGLRQTKQGSSELAHLLREAEVKIGRRVYYKVNNIAALMSTGASGDPHSGTDTGANVSRIDHRRDGRTRRR